MSGSLESQLREAWQLARGRAEAAGQPVRRSPNVEIGGAKRCLKPWFSGFQTPFRSECKIINGSRNNRHREVSP
jgi:hypothetical protein